MALVNLFGPVDAIFGAELGFGDVLVIEAVLLALVLVNFVTRRVAHGRHVSQAEDGAEAVSRWPVHELVNFLLVLGSLYYVTINYPGGLVMAPLAIGLFITDFFEFEARKVEARRELPLERPKGSLVASFVLLLYAGYQALFFLIAPFYGSVV
ncbi:hypothetical protein ACKVMT_01055 [Halobacteriales archaeon Cl-PHB]